MHRSRARRSHLRRGDPVRPRLGRGSEAHRHVPARARLIGAVAALATVLSGCGGLVALDVRSTPPGAKVYVADELLGVTPTGVVLHRTSEPRLAVTFEKLGYKPVAIYLPIRTWDSEGEARDHKVTLERELAPR